MTIPEQLLASCRKTPERMSWLNALPFVSRELTARWRLRIVHELGHAQPTCSWVAAVARANGTPAVLKLGMPHMEGEQEIEGLRFWDGDPTVRLLKFDAALGAMLLEHCEPGTHLRTLPETEQDVVIAGLMR